jgi:hypothetical protein
MDICCGAIDLTQYRFEKGKTRAKVLPYLLAKMYEAFLLNELTYLMFEQCCALSLGALILSRASVPTSAES